LERLVAVLDAYPAIAILMNHRFEVAWANQRAVAETGYALDEIIGRSVMDFLDPEWDAAAYDSIGTALEARGVRAPTVFRVTRKDGTKLMLEITANSQMDDPVLQGMVLAGRRCDERYFLDKTLESMAASAPLDETLRMIIKVAEAEVLDAQASLLYDRTGDRYAGWSASTELALDLIGPTLGRGDDVVRAWSDVLGDLHSRVTGIRGLPAVLRDQAEAAGLEALWVWPSAPTGRQPAAMAVAWRRVPRIDSDQSVVAAMDRLARLAGLVVERARTERRTLSAILFTDIIESTRTAAEVGDRAWQQLLTHHDSVVRAEIDRQLGHEIKHTGDGFVATFDGASRAIRAGHAIVAQVKELGLEARAGVHVAEAQPYGSDLAGVGVHIAARVGAAAGPSEVIVTRAVKDIVAGGGFRFCSRGSQQLKGIADAWELFEVTAPPD
jgi:PAS domain S-box-containing protein